LIIRLPNEDNFRKFPSCVFKHMAPYLYVCVCVHIYFYAVEHISIPIQSELKLFRAENLNKLIGFGTNQKKWNHSIFGQIRLVLDRRRERKTETISIQTSSPKWKIILPFIRKSWINFAGYTKKKQQSGRQNPFIIQQLFIFLSIFKKRERW
jgi:hypothetical protein